MNYEVLAIEIVAALGGSKNIQAVTHCATRLRFNLVDEQIVDTKQVENINGVMGVSNKGGQYQLIIGNTVSAYYEEVEKLISGTQETTETVKKKGVQSFINAIFDVLSGTFVMFIPVLIAAGMISAVLAILTSFQLVSTEDPTYLVFSGIQSAIFYFLPIFAGYAAGTKLKMNPFVGMALGAILCFSTFNGAENLSVFGLQVPTVTYSSTVFPIILGVTVMSFIEKGLKKVIPDVLKSLIIPTITLLLGVLITLFLLGPIGSLLGSYLSEFITIISKHAGWLAPSLIALIYPIMVFTGMHYSLIPLVMTSFATVGFDPLLMVAGFIGNFAEAGVASSALFLEKDKVKKAETSAIAISALCGVTEPALFGITLRNKKNLIAVCLGGFFGALFAGIMSCKAFGFVGGLPSLPLFLDPKGGFYNLFIIVVSIIISFGVTFILSFVLNRGKKHDEI